MGFIGVVFLNVVNEIPKYWINNNNFDSPNDFEFFRGKIYWILIPSGVGLVIGIIRYWLAYPEVDEAAGSLYQDINACHVKYHHSISTFLISLMSLSAGANLGPEVALVLLISTSS